MSIRDSQRIPSALSRRAVLRSSVAGVLCFGLAPAARALPRPASDPGGRLVLLQLSGGNDGLSTVVPWADDAYHRARPTLRIEPERVLRLDDYRGFHPALRGLAARWSEGEVALIEGVGYADPLRSHFKSMDVWHAGDRRGRLAGAGWVGRLAAHLGEPYDPLRVVHVGERIPFSLYHADHSAVAFRAPEDFQWAAHGAELTELGGKRPDGADGAGGAGPSVLERLRRAAAAAGQSADRVRASVTRHKPVAAYPSGALGSALRVAAALVSQDEGCRVVSVELGGFDHHNDLRNRHDRLMETLDAALTPFLADLQASAGGRSTSVLVFSEFGRRVVENGSRGADHGQAAPVLVLGPAARGGLYGAHPSLTELNDGDLAYTTDVGAVYGGLIEGLFGLSARDVLSTDARPLALVRRA